MFFKNKCIWITGASSGIGEALAYILAKKEAILVLSARREGALKSVAERCKTLGSPSQKIVPIDLSDMQAIDTITQDIIATYKRIDIVIHNGGISQRSFVKDTTIAVDRRLMEVNYFGAVALTKSVLPYMLTQQSGHFVVMSSLAGKFGFPMRSGYSATKHAMIGFFESLGLELQDDGIRVSIICPGLINTNISYNALDEQGNPFNEMSEGQAKGMPVEACAKKIVTAIAKGKHEVYIGGKEVLMVYLKRYLPALHRFIAARVNPN